MILRNTDLPLNVFYFEQIDPFRQGYPEDRCNSNQVVFHPSNPEEMKREKLIEKVHKQNASFSKRIRTSRQSQSQLKESYDLKVLILKRLRCHIAHTVEKTD